jgi:hypothetical protein
MTETGTHNTTRGGAVTGRPRSLPGYATAVFTFCLALFLSAGGGQALALWNQHATLAIQVTAETMPPPTLSCAQGSNNQTVIVSWVPQRAGVTSYRVSVTRDGAALYSRNYPPGTTTETLDSTSGLLDVLSSRTYSVIVEANYGTWKANAAEYSGIRAQSGVLGLLSTISCS